jgi:hypothetical protein
MLLKEKRRREERNNLKILSLIICAQEPESLSRINSLLLHSVTVQLKMSLNGIVTQFSPPFSYKVTNTDTIMLLKIT